MRVPSSRWLAVDAIAATAIALAVVVTLAARGAVGGATAVQLVAAIAVLGALAVVLVGLLVVVRRLAALSRRLARSSERTTTDLSTVARDVSDLTRQVSAVSAELSAAGQKHYSQVEAYVDLRNLILPRAPLPALRGWAASPDVLHLLAETMWRQRPELIVECGSGSSSVWLGYLAEQAKPSRVVCLEHDERYARMSRDLIRAHDLDAVVEIRYAPLADWSHGDRTYAWYDTETLKDLTDIGLLFVDGPPGTIGPQARFPAVPLLLPHCGDDAVIVLDDTIRDEETAISDRWLEEHPELERAVLSFDKGAHMLTRRVT
jgi:predicted O-methyltransferase YrrM